MIEDTIIMRCPKCGKDLELTTRDTYFTLFEGIRISVSNATFRQCVACNVRVYPAKELRRWKTIKNQMLREVVETAIPKLCNYICNLDQEVPGANIAWTCFGGYSSISLSMHDKMKKFTFFDHAVGTKVNFELSDPDCFAKIDKELP